MTNTDEPRSFGQQAPGQPAHDASTLHAPVPPAPSPRRDGERSTALQDDASPARPRRRILGIQPVLFVGILLLALVSIITIVLIFLGDFESQAPRVIATVVVFLAFTLLLSLDLFLARRRALPLVIGVIANIYVLAVLMVVIWMRPVEMRDSYYNGERAPDTGLLFVALAGIVILTLLVVRVAAAAAHGLVLLGEKGRASASSVIGMVAASLVGLSAILLTLHFALDALGLEVGEWYWRSTVAVLVLAALAASTTVLLFWNRRNLDYQDALERGDDPDAQRARGAVAPPVVAQAGQGGARPAAAAPAAPQHAWQQPQMLPWPTYPDGTPLPMGPDGQPDFGAYR